MKDKIYNQYVLEEQKMKGKIEPLRLKDNKTEADRSEIRKLMLDLIGLENDAVKYLKNRYPDNNEEAKIEISRLERDIKHNRDYTN